MHHIKHELLKKGHYREFDSQDMRLMGGFRKTMPVTFYVYVICALSLIGIPFFSGYLSKEAILADAFIYGFRGPAFFIVPLLAFATVFITSFYMIRQIIIVFFGDLKLGKVFGDAEEILKEIKDPTSKMKIPLILLAILSFWIFFSLNPLAYLGSYQNVKQLNNLILISTFSAIALSLAGIVVSYTIYKRKIDFYHPKPTPARSFLFHNFLLDQFYYKVLVDTGFKTAAFFKDIDTRVLDLFVHSFAVLNVVFAHFIAWVDRALIDGIVNLSAYFSGKAGTMTRSLQLGKIQGYFIISLLALIFFIIWTII